MVFFNHATRQMTAKIVYYGPGLCGKTTNLSAIYEATAVKARGEMVSLNTETDRTLFFDLLPMEVGVIGGFKAKLQLYTVPGQVFYNSTRKLVLKGVDGIVFVADSQAAMQDANRESLLNLSENLRELGLNLGDVPMVFQWNKRDLKQIIMVETLERELNPRGAPSFPAVASTGEGVFETLRGISRLALAQIKRQYLGDTTPAQPEPFPPSQGGRPEPAARSAAPPGTVYVPDAPPAIPPWSAPTPANATEAHPGGSPPARRTMAPMLPTPPLNLPAASAPEPPGSETDPGTSPGLRTGESLVEALSFLDLSGALDLFDTKDDESQPGSGTLAPDQGGPAGGQVKVMPPLFVNLPPPQPFRGPALASPGPLGANGLPRPRLAPRPPAPVPMPRISWPSPPAYPGASGSASGGIARPVPVLQVVLPQDVEDGDLELQVLVRHKGVVVAEAAANLPGGGGSPAGTLSIELKRS